MKSSGGASGSRIYWYDESGQVIMESRQDGSILNEYLYVGGQRVARVANLGSIYYYYGDHLGTARLITNGGGTTCYDADYFPWGGEQNVYVPTCQQNYKFTGKERDPDMGVDYFGARFYSHSMARFYSPDPLLNSGRPGNPQNWNRYAYVLGNPLKFTDPTGLWDWAPNTCAASDKRCNKQYQNDQKKFRQGLKELKDARDSYKKGSKEYNRLDASLKAYGTENDGNNVTVGFGALPGSTAARATLSADEQGNLSFNVTFDPSKVGNAAPVDIGHEGTHVSDIDNPWYAGAGTLEPFQLEYRGYQTSSWVAQGLGVPTMTTAEGNVLWNPSWSAADREVMRDYGITNQVEDKDHPETQFHNPWPN